MINSMSNPNKSCLASAVLVVLALGCGDEQSAPPVKNLDRPSAMAFGCYGQMRANGGDVSQTDAPVKLAALPLTACNRKDAAPGQEDLLAPTAYGFVLQSARGSVGIVNGDVVSVLDSDPLSPGKNAIPIATLPVDIAADQAGCFVVTANAGSCDLSALSVTSAVDPAASPSILRLPIKRADGTPLLARPRKMVVAAQNRIPGTECGETPQGTAYISYPECQAIAAVDLATGTVVSSVRFDENGTPSIGDGNLDCATECSSGEVGEAALINAPAGAMPDAGVDAGVDGGPDGGLTDAGTSPDAAIPPANGDGRATSLVIAPDGNLFLASEDDRRIFQITLAPDGIPTAVTGFALSGDVGVTSFAVTDVIGMGGDLGMISSTAGDYRFIYAVTTDRTVRVFDITHNQECDTQVDPRYLHEEKRVGFLSCMPVGGPETPPRRPGAKGPGIELPGEALPLSVSFAQVETPDADKRLARGLVMVGTFAFITASNGGVYIANVDDDNYYDFEDSDHPIYAAMTLALPHQLRDAGQKRDDLTDTCISVLTDSIERGPRLTDAVTLAFSADKISPAKVDELPVIRQLSCESEGATSVISELSFAAPDAVREAAFPDSAVIIDEIWSLLWEGALANDRANVDVDGVRVRSGLIDRKNGFEVVDPSGSFCELGAELYDTLTLVGCDPGFGNSQCGVGETCFVHPDSPVGVSTGVCMPDSEIEKGLTNCRDFLVSRKQFSIKSVSAGRVSLAEKYVALRTTPINGCTSKQECLDLAVAESELTSDVQPIDSQPVSSEFDWECAVDPSRSPGISRCLMSCETSDDCDVGRVCNEGLCVEGVVPAAQCVTASQRYTVNATDAFVVTGSRTGYLHPWIANINGECVKDALASPGLIGRLPLVAPDCTGPDFTSSPNPCSETISHAEYVTPYKAEGNACIVQSQELRTEDRPSIRFSNPAWTVHLVNPSTTGDATCLGDREGTLPPFSPVFPGFEIRFGVRGGIAPMFVDFTPFHAAYPRSQATAPDGRVWILDEGDSTRTTNGQLFVFNPEDSSTGFGLLIAQ